MKLVIFCTISGKMDLPRALGALGFSTSRVLEAETELDKRRALIDKALFNCTQVKNILIGPLSLSLNIRKSRFLLGNKQRF